MTGQQTPAQAASAYNKYLVANGRREQRRARAGVSIGLSPTGPRSPEYQGSSRPQATMYLLNYDQALRSGGLGCFWRVRLALKILYRS